MTDLGSQAAEDDGGSVRLSFVHKIMAEVVAGLSIRSDLVDEPECCRGSTAADGTDDVADDRIDVRRAQLLSFPHSQPSPRPFLSLVPFSLFPREKRSTFAAPDEAGLGWAWRQP